MWKKFFFVVGSIFMGLITVSCQAKKASAIPMLASFTENSVQVVVQLEPGNDGTAVLAVTFTPTDAGYHLYSKDIPREGVNGLGRPTLVELTAKSQIQADGDLQESPSPQVEPIKPDLPDLKVYPPGPVILHLPIKLPVTNGAETAITDEIAVTYMACTPNTCKRPVEGKIIPLSIPIAR